MFKITVAVPCYNSERYISRCIDSLVNQSMPADEYEIICVDDRSTDRTVDILHEYESRYTQLKVIKRKTNSGGPGKPRNQAIEAAKGKYIFFVDSDDFLGPEALERMYRFAEEHDSDVVLGKMKGVNGRPVPQAIFKQTNPDVGLIDSALVYALGPTKMFRVSMLRENDIDFPSNIQATEDQVFVMSAYLHAHKISVLADYDCYYAVLREGEHMTFAYVSPEDYYGAMKVIIDMIKSSTLSESQKEKLTAKFLNRHFEFSRTTDFTEVLETESEQIEWMNELHLFVEKNISPAIDLLVKNHFRLKLFFIRNNDLTGFKQFEREEADIHDFTSVDQGNIYGDFPSLSGYDVPREALKMNHKNKLIHFIEVIEFKDRRLMVKGSVHHSALQRQAARQKVTGVWVNRQNKAEKTFIPDVSEGGRFEFSFYFDDIAETESDFGVWDFFIDSEIDGYTKRGRIGRNREPYHYASHARYIGNNGFCAYYARPYFTKDYDNLSLDIQKQTSLKIEFSKEDANGLLTITVPGQQLFFPEQSILLLRVNEREMFIPIKRVIAKSDNTEIQIARHLIGNKFGPVGVVQGQVEMFINSYHTLLEPKKDDLSTFLCSARIEKKRLFFHMKKKVDYRIKANHSTFYLTRR
ncbi:MULTISPECIES: glycosyltransferase [Bacillus]|uniref:Glycosyltransferase n=1 Tax=Bacillus paralicheniformis TaxID=1648923 RepID=A0AAW6KCP0_9BACI|nr:MULTISPECIES: glycosyltransferase [Bacillus]MDE1383153.1 glycosyltransferase [Bacillus paralicheniformis]MDE1451261.1 glycosyltransferase [Bacillus paralicheniformis]MED4308816.1 glycosyltransferase [Bacillus paralicheniformis]MED4348852.1 glycosyltransferase [Bacillus paralicheniformis]PRS12341.1 glycosyltransferase family 2 protein [Bacillus paralicheniformis]